MKKEMTKVVVPVSFTGSVEGEFGLDEATAGKDWDGCAATGASGQWSLGAADHATVVERLADKADSAGLRPEDLDEVIHEMASSVAADVNNSGLEDQVRYLVEWLGPRDAERQLDELVEERKKEGD